jgi:hypothetical protein
MQAIFVNTEGVVLRDVPQPSPRPEQVLVRVRAGARLSGAIRRSGRRSCQGSCRKPTEQSGHTMKNSADQ